MDAWATYCARAAGGAPDNIVPIKHRITKV
jgi:hypothetical protein